MMTESKSITRRRVIQIMAMVGGSCLIGSPSAARGAPQIWHGRALGADAFIRLYHDNADEGFRLLNCCITEINRLENVFSLYRANSAVSQLNRQGYLNVPPVELVNLLHEARNISTLTQGAFDITVQPLWDLYSKNIRRAGEDYDGPDQIALRRALKLVNFHGVRVRDQRIELDQLGMKVTMNGIAQGYITDKVIELLRESGVSNVLVNLGEYRALGRHGTGRPWNIGIQHPNQDAELSAIIPLDNAALATSGGYGTPLSSDTRHHHLFDPTSGYSTHRYQDVTVLAPTATMADGLSTGFSSMNTERISAVIEKLTSVSALVTESDGRIRSFPA